jgi:hypothetical protein
MSDSWDEYVNSGLKTVMFKKPSCAGLFLTRISRLESFRSIWDCRRIPIELSEKFCDASKEWERC